jgi:hypothetical protein
MIPCTESNATHPNSNEHTAAVADTVEERIMPHAHYALAASQSMAMCKALWPRTLRAEFSTAHLDRQLPKLMHNNRSHTTHLCQSVVKPKWVANSIHLQMRQPVARQRSLVLSSPDTTRCQRHISCRPSNC